MSSYDDIRHLSRPPSSHPPMGLRDRAAQFSPFAALTGHKDAITEAGRITEERLPLSDVEQAELDDTLRELRKLLPSHPRIKVTYFVADELKEGGSYQHHEGAVRTIDEYHGRLVFENGPSISLAAIDGLHLQKKP